MHQVYPLVSVILKLGSVTHIELKFGYFHLLTLNITLRLVVNLEIPLRTTFERLSKTQCRYRSPLQYLKQIAKEC